MTTSTAYTDKVRHTTPSRTLAPTSNTKGIIGRQARGPEVSPCTDSREPNHPSTDARFGTPVSKVSKTPVSGNSRAGRRHGAVRGIRQKSRAPGRSGIAAVTSVLLLVGLLASSASAEGGGVIWRGDFETGDLSQWSKTQMVSPDRLQIVSDPVRQGRYALKTTVRSGDDPIGASGNRNELVIAGIDRTGSERVYRWNTLFPEDFQSADTWHLFTQWHHDGSDGSPPVEFFVWGETIFLRVDGEDVWSTPLERGRWLEFVFKVKWARNGWVELYYNGELALPRTSASTLYEGQGVYLKQGLYRDASVNQTQVVYHDGMTVADSMEALQSDSGDGALAGGNMFGDGDGGGGCASASLAGAPALLAGLFMILRRRGKKAKDAVK